LINIDHKNLRQLAEKNTTVQHGNKEIIMMTPNALKIFV
jgi:hypothetical protein